MNILEACHLESTKGEVGIEVEVVGRHLPQEVVGWKVEHDDSLRAGGLEYVLKGPKSRDKLDLYLSRLEKKLNEDGVTVGDSVQAGVHVHINVQELSVDQMYTFLCMYLMLESLLVKTCGDGAEGNLFCLRACDAEYLIHLITKARRSDRLDYLNTDNIRYASCNVMALFKFGSLEFRAFRTDKNFDGLRTWVGTLLQLKDASKNYGSPAELIESFSVGDYDTFLRTVLGEYAEQYINSPHKNELMKEGMRLAQDIAYAKPSKVEKKGQFEWTNAQVEDSTFTLDEAMEVAMAPPTPAAGRPMMEPRGVMSGMRTTLEPPRGRFLREGEICPRGRYWTHARHPPSGTIKRRYIDEWEGEEDE